MASYFNVFLLILYLKKRIGGLGLKKIAFSGAKSTAAAAAAGISAWYVCGISENVFISVPAAIVAGVFAFFAVSKLSGSQELDSVLKIFKEKKRKIQS